MNTIEVENDVPNTERFGFLNETEKIASRRTRQPTRNLMYGVGDEPPASLAVLLSLQNVITAIGGIIFVTNILAPKFCILREDPAQAYILSTAILMAGISTMFQILVGTKLPIVQNSGFVYMTCTLSLLNLSRWECPSEVDLFSMGHEARTLEWQLRARNIQGSMIIVSIIQMLLGYSGFVGNALKYITPVTVVPTMCLVGLSVVEKGVLLMSGNWTTAIITLFLLMLFSQYLRKCSISFFVYSFTKGWIKMSLRLFELFSISISVAIVWAVCIYMTNRNNLLPTDPSNTESKLGVYNNAQLFRLPYPFQWGLPTFSLTSILAMLPALFTSIVESIGNYYTCAKLSNLPQPPKNAMNRGIGVQGISSILAGVLGTGSGIGSSGENVGNICITRVCSRNVIILAACTMIFISPFTKVIALFVTLPDPVLGAVTSVLLVLITAVALSNLQYINLNSMRNMFILGMSMFFGLALPKYISTHEHFINTRCEIFNDVIFIYLSSGMFIGGMIGFILDNTIPDDGDDVLNSNNYSYHVNDALKSSIEIEDDKVYDISESLVERIHCFLTLFL